MRAIFLFSVQLNTNLQWKKKINNIYIYILYISIYLYKRSIKLTQCLRLFQHKPPPQPVQYLILMTIAHQIRHPLANAARCYCSQATLWSSSSPVGSDCSRRVWLGKSGAASWRSVWSPSRSDLLAVSPSWFFLVFLALYTAGTGFPLSIARIHCGESVPLANVSASHQLSQACKD